MDLFESLDNQPSNLLPYDGEVLYYGRIMSQSKADAYYQLLMDNIAWQHDEAEIFGKKITTKRKVAWYAEKAFSPGKIPFPIPQPMMRGKFNSADS